MSVSSSLYIWFDKKNATLEETSISWFHKGGGGSGGKKGYFF
jgi:hypothetical protein